MAILASVVLGGVVKREAVKGASETTTSLEATCKPEALPTLDLAWLPAETLLPAVEGDLRGADPAELVDEHRRSSSTPAVGEPSYWIRRPGLASALALDKPEPDLVRARVGPRKAEAVRSTWSRRDEDEDEDEDGGGGGGGDEDDSAAAAIARFRPANNAGGGSGTKKAKKKKGQRWPSRESLASFMR